MATYTSIPQRPQSMPLGSPGRRYEASRRHGIFECCVACRWHLRQLSRFEKSTYTSAVLGHALHADELPIASYGSCSPTYAFPLGSPDI